MLRSLRNRLLALFLALVVVVGAATMYAIERSLASDLLAALDARLSAQGRAVADWIGSTGDPRQLAERLAAVTGTRITIVGADGLVQGDSAAPSAVGSPIGDASEVAEARRGGLGHAVRELGADQPRQYLVAVTDRYGRVIRLAVPLDNVIETRARMRDRLIVGFGFGFLGALFLSWIFVRAITRPIQSITRTAERLAAGEWDAAPPELATAAGGELAVLANAMMHMAGEVTARVGDLRQERDLLSVVFASLVEGVVVIDRSGAVALANAAARPLIGGDGGDRDGDGGGDRDDGGRAELPSALRELVDRARGGGNCDAEIALGGRTVRASARPLEAAAVIVVLYDVTRIRALEAVRAEFLSNAAHELRTPVTSISGYAETLLAGDVDGETSKEFLSTIHRNAQRITSLVADLVLLDQLGGRDAKVMTRVPVALAQVVDDAARTTKGIAPAAQIAVAVPAELAVLGTREGLDHVVQNLVDNAVKYGGGTPVAVRAERHGAHVRLAVIDAGPGIPKGFEERVFERFYRVDPGRSRAQGGSGLGLAIVKSQVEAMGGRVWLEHAEPGARFVIELDAA